MQNGNSRKFKIGLIINVENSYRIAINETTTFVVVHCAVVKISMNQVCSAKMCNGCFTYAIRYLETNFRSVY